MSEFLLWGRGAARLHPLGDISQADQGQNWGPAGFGRVFPPHPSSDTSEATGVPLGTEECSKMGGGGREINNYLNHTPITVHQNFPVLHSSLLSSSCLQ